MRLFCVRPTRMDALVRAQAQDAPFCARCLSLLKRLRRGAILAKEKTFLLTANLIHRLRGPPSPEGKAFASMSIVPSGMPPVVYFSINSSRIKRFSPARSNFGV